MVARLKGVRDYNDAFFKNRDRDAIVTILTKYTPVKDSATYAKMSVGAIDPDGRLDLQSLEEQQDWYAAHGYVAQKIDVSTAVSMDFTEHALRVLGPYQ